MLFGGETLEQGARELGFDDWSSDVCSSDLATLANGKGENTTDGGHTIDTDEVRKLSPEYRANPRLSPLIHKAASALTKRLFARALARPVAEGREPVVVFTAGGGGSGKSTARKRLMGEADPDILYDGTLSNLARVRADVEAALKSEGGQRQVQIVYVYRSPENSADAATGRAVRSARPVPVAVLEVAHAGARNTGKALDVRRRRLS